MRITLGRLHAGERRKIIRRISMFDVLAPREIWRENDLPHLCVQQDYLIS